MRQVAQSSRPTSSYSTNLAGRLLVWKRLYNPYYCYVNRIFHFENSDGNIEIFFVSIFIDIYRHCIFTKPIETKRQRYNRRPLNYIHKYGYNAANRSCLTVRVVDYAILRYWTPFNKPKKKNFLQAISFVYRLV